MNKIFTLIPALAMAVNVMGAETAFTADFSTADEASVADWTIIDANADKSTWKFDSSAEPSHIFYSYNSNNAADDWLISPAISIPADGTYVLRIEYKGSSYGEAFEVFTGSEAKVESMTNKIASYEDVKDVIAGDLVFIDAKAGNMHIGFHATTPADKFRLYLISVTLMKADNPVDLALTAITSPTDGEGLGQETVTVEIENKGRVDVSSYDVAYKLNDGTAVVEHVTTPIAVGAKATYSFNTKADLSRGHFTHKIEAYTIHPDDINPANDSFSAKVRHVAPATVPYFTGFEPDEDTDGITFLNLNNDEGDWDINIDSGWLGSFARTGYGSLIYNYDKENNADDWAILEPIQMTPGHYAVKFWYSATANHPERMRLCYGNAPTPEAMTNVVVEYNPMTNDSYLESVNIIELKEEGNIYFGFYAFSDKNENWICIDDFSVTKVDANNFDIIVSRPSNPMSYMMDKNSRDLAFTVFNAGIVDKDIDFEVSVDGNVISTFTMNIPAQKATPIVRESLFTSLATGTHTIRIEAKNEGDTDPSNNVSEFKCVMLPAPVAFWDFEDGQLPTDITMRVEDSAENHPNAGDEFNEDGFGIFNLQHYLLGTRALAINTWFTDPSKTADRWVVLPRMKVTGDAHFAMSAVSYGGGNGTDRFDIRVSTSDDKWYSYSTVLSVSDVQKSVNNFGIDLSEYKDKDIYIAVQCKSYDTEALILDNLGVYGSIEPSSTQGIDDIETSTEPETVEYYNLSGIRLAQPCEGLNIVVRKQGGKTIVTKEMISK